MINGSSSSYTFDISGTNEYHSGIIYEIENCNINNPINKSAIISRGTSLNPSTDSVIPSILNTLPISAAVTVNGSINSFTINEVNSLWNIDQVAATSWLDTFSSHKNVLSIDSKASISNTFVFNSLTMGAVMSIVLLNPA